MNKEVKIIALISGFLILLPLGKFLLPLILIFPGLCLYTLFRDKPNAVELAAASITLSLLLIPVLAVFAHLAHIPTSIVLALFILILSTISMRRGIKISFKRDHLIVILIALLVSFFSYIPLSTSFTVTDAGLTVSPTHAGDLNYHLSIINRYITDGQIPPEDPYLPGHFMPYHWLMHLFMGELCNMTQLSPFLLLKIIFPLLLSVLFLNMYLLSEYIFDSSTAIFSSLLYIFSSGLSWIYLAWLYIAGKEIDLFRVLIYSWNSDMLKNDPTLLFYLLPQTQSFALVIMIFILFLWIFSINEYSRKMAALAGFSLGVLTHYHMISAFPIFALMGAYALYRIKDRKVFEISAIVLFIALFISLFQLLLFSSETGSQLSIGHHPNILLSALLSLGVLVPFGVIGAIKSVREEKARAVLIFALVLIVILNVLTLPLSQNTYRFLVYLTIPVSIFSGYFIRLHWESRLLMRVLIVAGIILILPSTMILIGYYSGVDYVHVTSGELLALNWVEEQTSVDDIFLEKPDMFPRIPLITGRRIAYAGPLYMVQYHGVDEWQWYSSLFDEVNSSRLNSKLHSVNVSYVFVGSKEATFKFNEALNDEVYFKKVYNNDDGIRIYEVI